MSPDLTCGPKSSARLSVLPNMLRILFAEPKAAVAGPAIFIDRDGVINCRRLGDYVLEWSQFIFVPGIRDALKHLATLGLPIIVISNQAAVGKGLLDQAGLEEITARMQQAFVSHGASFAAAYYCIHRPDENCPCRKPKPGLLEKAAGDFHIDLRRSIFIGDSESDVQAARAAGCQPVLFGGPDIFSDSTRLNLPTAVTADALFDVAAKLLQRGGEAQAGSDPAL
jgi:D-glycero-D-manno-heptose 1,7-bisphosphate phosphatase